MHDLADGARGEPVSDVAGQEEEARARPAPVRRKSRRREVNEDTVPISVNDFRARAVRPILMVRSSRLRTPSGG